MKFNAHGPDGLIDRKAPGQPSKLTEAHRAALKAVIESGPTAAIDGVVRWRLVDLCQWIWEEFRVGIAKQTLSRELRAMGYRKLSARPRHHDPPPPKWSTLSYGLAKEDRDAEEELQAGRDRHQTAAG
jgi:transposase